MSASASSVSRTYRSQNNYSYEMACIWQRNTSKSDEGKKMIPGKTTGRFTAEYIVR